METLEHHKQAEIESHARSLCEGLPHTEIEIAENRARSWGSSAQFVVGDMDSMALEQSFDGVLVFDALHHSTRPGVVVENIACHLRPGGWVLFGEPSVLHSISPSARRAHRELGWTEKGISVLRLKRACTAAGLGNFKRYFEGTRPYQRGVASFGRQLLCLVAANFAFAPQTSVWLAAQKLPRP